MELQYDLPYGHDWVYSGPDRGEILVDVYTCRRCGAGWQHADPDDPDTTEDLLDWRAWCHPGDFSWDDEIAYLPCEVVFADGPVSLIVKYDEDEYYWRTDAGDDGPHYLHPLRLVEDIWGERDEYISAVLWQSAHEDDVTVALHTRDVALAPNDANAYLLTYGHVPEGGITHTRHWRLDCYPPDSPCGRLVSSSGRPDGYAEAVEWARRQVERVEMQ